MKYPEEYADFTLEQEKSFINEEFRDPNRIMIVCLVEGRYTKGQLDKTYRYIAFDLETGKVIIRVLGCGVLQKTVQISGKHCMGNTDGRSVIGYDVFIKRQEDYHDENSERSIGAIRRLSGYASLLR